MLRRFECLNKFVILPLGSRASARQPFSPPDFIDAELFARAFIFFVGVGPGPDGLQMDFLRFILGSIEDDPILLFYGTALAYLRPCVARGN